MIKNKRARCLITIDEGLPVYFAVVLANEGD